MPERQLPNIDYEDLQKITTKEGRKYDKIKSYILQRNGADLDAKVIDEKIRLWFEDMVTEIIKSPESFDRTRNINFMELFNSLTTESKNEGQ